jgi:hypothetical protein
MPAGLLSFYHHAVKGSSDVSFLVGKPSVSHFIGVVRRYANFSRETREIPRHDFVGTMALDTPASLGQRATYVVQREADLLSNVMVEVKVPNVYRKAEEHFASYPPNGSNSSIRWINSLERYVIEYVEVYLNETLVQKHGADWLEVWHELNAPSASSPPSFPPQSSGASLSGTHHTYPSSSDLGYDPFAGRVSGGTLVGRTFYVPLQLWFSRDPSLALPLLAMSRTTLRLVVKTRDLHALVHDDPSAPLAHVTGSDGTSVKVYGEFVYLDSQLSRYFAHKNHRYLVDMPVEVTQQASYGAWNTVKLDALEHLTKELVWVVKSFTGVGDLANFTCTPHSSEQRTLSVSDATRVGGFVTRSSNSTVVYGKISATASYAATGAGLGTELVVGSPDLTFDTSALSEKEQLRFAVGDVVRLGASELHSVTLIVSETSGTDHQPTKFRVFQRHLDLLTETPNTDDFSGVLSLRPTQTRFRNVYVEFSGENFTDAGDTITVAATDDFTIRHLREDATALDRLDWFEEGDVLTLGSRAYASAVDHAAPEAETRCTLLVTQVSSTTGLPTELEVVSRSLLQVGPTTYPYDTLVSVTSQQQTFPDGTATQRLRVADVEKFSELPTLGKVAQTYAEYVSAFGDPRVTQPVERAQVRLGSLPRTHEHEGRYFSYVQPARHHNRRRRGRGVYAYSFANDPYSAKGPGGACNLTPVRGTHLRVLLRPKLYESQDANPTVHVFSLQHCVFYITRGVAGMLYGPRYVAGTA